MENASQYSSIRSTLMQRISLEVKNQRRADAECCHTLALKSEAIEAELKLNYLKSCQGRLS